MLLSRDVKRFTSLADYRNVALSEVIVASLAYILCNLSSQCREKKGVSLEGSFYERQRVIMDDHQLSSFSASPVTEVPETISDGELPEALQAPTRRVGAPFVLTIALAQ